MMLTVTEIRIYPVKGLRGCPLVEASVEPWGLAGDRRWLVTDSGGRFVSQREAPLMARIEATAVTGGLVLSADGFGCVDVAAPDAAGGDAVEVTIWRDRVMASPADGAVGEWLSNALGRPGCRLVYMGNPAAARPVNQAYASPEDRVSFADGFPVLLTTTASLADVNARLDRAVPMDRFRPNLVVTGSRPWDEDRWSTLRVGGGADAVPFRVAKPCDRCVVTTIDQRTGEKAHDGEPLRTIAALRTSPHARTAFGQNLIPCGEGRVALGDAVEATPTPRP